jgi:rSAM/selenodomain-associated transferase 1
MSENLLMVFVKYPAPGAVKQRLAQHLGTDRAVEIYKKIAETIVQKVTPASSEDYILEIYFSPQEDEKLVRQWLNENEYFSPQQGSDLGARMNNAFQHPFAAGYTKALLIGSDCPDISRTIVSRGFMLLDTHDIVLGPAHDGGYYLIGLRRPVPELFSCIEWGTECVLQQTLDKINALGLTVALLPELWDIDRIEDLKYYNHVM